MKVKRKAKVLTITALLGGALTYLLDPQAGRQRRERLARTAERRRADVSHLTSSVERVVDAVSPTSPNTPASDVEDSNAHEQRSANPETPNPTGPAPAIAGVTDVATQA